jgi:hypothetical protein
MLKKPNAKTAECQQRQANLFLGSDRHNRMKTMMENRHTGKRKQTDHTMDTWLFLGEARDP